ncbi:MAG TPA: META domain-containing protein [Usitatibacter sp.]|nr:META domain-containing protein [Usitatibacter sp.]
MSLRPAPLALALLLCACALPDREPPPRPFAATRWDVVLEVPLPGEPPWFRFGDGRVQGFGGCNAMHAEYLQDSVGARAIAVRRIETGGKSCDPTAKAVENRLLAVLQSVSSYTITGDIMRMSGSAGTILLRAHPEEAKR